MVLLTPEKIFSDKYFHTDINGDMLKSDTNTYMILLGEKEQ